MNHRERLPNRRAAETFEVEVNGLRYTATVGRFADGRIGELFLANHKSNSQADTNNPRFKHRTLIRRSARRGPARDLPRALPRLTRACLRPARSRARSPTRQ